LWPALDVRDAGGSDRLLLALDDYQATALEPRGDAAANDVRVFFADVGHRDEALAGLPPAFQARPVDVPDEDWARRSQLQLTPITVGRLTIFPTAESKRTSDEAPQAPGTGALLIQPSMGFGTGHHATTRLCLSALQTLDLSNLSVIDVGTGSGILALASRLLGAGDVLGIDYDADAIQSAEENRILNPAADQVRFAVGDFRTDFDTPSPISGRTPADVVTANLTGAVLTRYAEDLLRLLRTGGTLIISGVQVDERDGVFAALTSAHLAWELEEDGWIGAAFTRLASPGA
jgi:ribosomal protein L11 methyltransferase